MNNPVDALFVEDVLLPWLAAVLNGVETGRYADDSPLDWPALWEREVLARADGTTLARLQAVAGLDRLDTLLLALASAPYLNPELARRIGELQGSSLTDRATVGFILDVLHPSGRGRLADLTRFDPEAPLFQWRLVELGEPVHGRGDSLVEKVVCVPQRTIDLLLGHPRLDQRIRGFCRVETMPIRLEQVVLPPASRDVVLSLVANHERRREATRRYGFDKVIPYGRSPIVLLAGPPGTGKTLFARALSHATSRPLFRVFSDKLAETAEAIEPIIAALFDEALLHGALVFFDECEALFSRRGPKLAFLLTELERHDGVVVLATNVPEQLDPAMERRIVYRMDFELPGPAFREQIWEMHLPPDAPIDTDVDIALLANLFNFSGALIKNAVLLALNAAIQRSPEAPSIDMGLLRAAAESQLRHSLGDTARKSHVDLTLADIVLPESERRRIDEVLNACRHKDFVQNRWGLGARLVTGKGVSVLFDGPPGTGKTLCAEIIARDLDRPLFRVHIPNVVSKWVGETEKNISQLFERAQATQSILLFDEADSLFSKRTDVKSSNDRYANQEINLLLQEVERYTGIVILTTNLFGGLDDAVKRRIQYRVTFPLPGPEERARIWETLMPRSAPVAPDVDCARLANVFAFAGGNIKNAIVRACYRAFGDGGQLTMKHLEDAARVECESAGMIVREGAITKAVNADARLTSEPRPRTVSSTSTPTRS